MSMGICTMCRGVTPEAEMQRGTLNGHVVMSLCPECYEKHVGDKQSKKVKFGGE